jgi:PAS domain S-box-containing protein
MVILIIVMTIVPLGIIVYSAYTEQRQDIREARLHIEQLVEDISNDQEILLSGAEQLLSTLSHLPDVKNHNAAAVSHLLKEIVNKNPQYSNLVISDKSGLQWAAAISSKIPIRAADRRFFRNALASGQFSSGEFAIGRILNKPVLNFAYPIKDASGQITDVAVVVFTLDKYVSNVNRENIPAGTSLLLTDHKGTIIFNATAPETIGTQDREDLFRQMTKEGEKGAFGGISNIGIKRYFAYKKLRLSGEQTPYMYVRAGTLVETVSNKTRSKLTFSIGAMLFLLLSAAGFALYISKRNIMDKIIALRNAALQLGKGNFNVRVADTVSGGELGELGQAFDDMSRLLAENASVRQQFEESLRESEAKYRILVETANEGIWVVGKDARTLFVNRKMAEILGYSAEEMLYKAVDAFIAPEDLDHYKVEMERRKAGNSSNFERRFLRKDGSVIYLQVSAAPLLDAEGSFTGSFAMINDVTERKHMEEKLYESNLLLEKTFSSLNEAIFIVETTTRTILDCNSTCEKMFGYNRDEMIGNSTAFLHTSAEMSQRFGNEMQQAYAEQGLFETTFVMKRKDGSIFDSEHSVTPIRNEIGEIVKHVCVVRDISRTKMMQHQLEARNRFVEAVIANLQSGIIVIDNDYQIIMLNHYAAEFSGEPPDNFIGRNLADICPELCAALASGRTAGEMPVTLFNRMHVIGFARFDLHGYFMDSGGAIINFKDLTEIIKIRKVLRHKERLSAMGEVVANVAHEMRNPLFAMTAIAQILEIELTLTPEQKALLESLLKEANRLNDLVAELLDSTRDLRLTREPVDLNTVIDQSLKILQIISEKRGITVRKNSYADTITLSADFEKLEQVVINLVNNAIEASPKGSYVDVNIEKGEGGVVISVIDSGEGIATEAMDRIFDIFYTTKKHGTGLGLSICRNIVEAHGGTLEARNNPGTGATFTAKLPFGSENR